MEIVSFCNKSWNYLLVTSICWWPVSCRTSPVRTIDVTEWQKMSGTLVSIRIILFIHSHGFSSIAAANVINQKPRKYFASFKTNQVSTIVSTAWIKAISIYITTPVQGSSSLKWHLRPYVRIWWLYNCCIANLIYYFVNIIKSVCIWIINTYFTYR